MEPVKSLPLILFLCIPAGMLLSLVEQGLQPEIVPAVDMAAEEAMLFRNAEPHGVLLPHEVRYQLREDQIATRLADGHYTTKIEVLGPTFRIVAGGFEMKPIAMDPDADSAGQEARAYVTLAAEVRGGKATVQITEVEHLVP